MILFVCTGNTCRSPLAAALARTRGADAESAGLCARAGDSATPQAIRAAARRGANLTGHAARPVTPGLMARAERVYAMTDAHAETLKALFPAQAGKVRMLTPRIPDPFGGDDAVYEACAQALIRALEREGL